MALDTMKCLFCSRLADNSKSSEHIIPESLGNKRNVLPPGIVCDTCNQYFAVKIEGPLLGGDYFRQNRFRKKIPNKRGRIPSLTLLTAPDPVVIEIKQHRDGSASMGGRDELQEARFAELIRSRRRFRALLPVAFKADVSLMERLMAKMAIESLALRLLNVEGGVQVVSNKTELDDLRSFARFGAPRKRWAIHVRDVYSPYFLFRDEHVGFYEVLHEFSFLYTKANELYYVCTIFGREYAINMGGPQLDGYESWLIKNAQRSPLDGRDSDYVYV